MNPPAPAPRTARQRRKETRPQELLDAALQLFVEKGYSATRIEEVAHQAGVSKGTLYLYYPSKAELFKAVVRHNLANLIQEGVGQVAAFEGPTSDLLRLLFELWWARVGHSQAGGIHKIVMAEVRNFPELAQFYADEILGPAEHLFTLTLQRGADRGEFRKVASLDVAHALMAPIIFLLLHQHSFGECPIGAMRLDPVATLAAHVDLVLHGLEVRPLPAKVQR